MIALKAEDVKSFTTKLFVRVAAGLQEILSRLDPDLHAVIPEQTPGRAGMHLSVDVKRREKRIERAGRRVHHEG